MNKRYIKSATTEASENYINNCMLNRHLHGKCNTCHHGTVLENNIVRCRCYGVSGLYEGTATCIYWEKRIEISK